jgi:plastocyanin
VLTLARVGIAGAVSLVLAGCAGAASLAPSVAPSVATPAASSAAPAASSAAPAASSAAPASAPGASTSAAAAGGDAVTIANFAFAPKTISLKTGATVTWTNTDGTAHTVTFDDGSESSQHLQQNQTFQRTFTAAGSFTYHCSIHPTMTATVTVSG